MQLNDNHENELKNLIEKSVDASVEKAFRKYYRASEVKGIGKKMIAVVLILCMIAGGAWYWKWSWDAKQKALETKPVEEHDLTLENDGILGFKTADFADPILGEASRQKLLIVEERDISVNTTITDAGFMNWKIFNKQQMLTIHGYGQYTIDLSEIHTADIRLNEDTHEVTIAIPHAELHDTIFNPDETEIGDTDKGWFAFGDITLTAEQQKAFETEAKEKLQEKLSKDKRFEEADRFAKLSAYEIYQPIVDGVSTAYKVVIVFKD